MSLVIADNSEGTGVWTLREIAGRHVAAPTIASAHQLRITSAFRRTRLKAHEALDLPLPKRLGDDKSFDQKEFLKDLRLAVYAGILGSYVQGMHVSDRCSSDAAASRD
jgi:6-phosphogluconate dehydrogenase